jgi:hypothetical protein
MKTEFEESKEHIPMFHSSAPLAALVLSTKVEGQESALATTIPETDDVIIKERSSSSLYMIPEYKGQPTTFVNQLVNSPDNQHTLHDVDAPPQPGLDEPGLDEPALIPVSAPI